MYNVVERELKSFVPRPANNQKAAAKIFHEDMRIYNDNYI